MVCSSAHLGYKLSKICITDPLWWETTGHRWIPCTKVSNHQHPQYWIDSGYSVTWTQQLTCIVRHWLHIFYFVISEKVRPKHTTSKQSTMMIYVYTHVSNRNIKPMYIRAWKCRYNYKHLNAMSWYEIDRSVRKLSKHMTMKSHKHVFDQNLHTYVCIYIYTHACIFNRHMNTGICTRAYAHL